MKCKPSEKIGDFIRNDIGAITRNSGFGGSFSEEAVAKLRNLSPRQFLKFCREVTQMNIQKI